MLMRGSPSPAPTTLPTPTSPTRWKYKAGLGAPCVVTRSAAATLFKRRLWIQEPARINEIKREGDAPSITNTWTSLTFFFFYKYAFKSNLSNAQIEATSKQNSIYKGRANIYIYNKYIYI